MWRSAALRSNDSSTISENHVHEVCLAVLIESRARIQGTEAQAKTRMVSTWTSLILHLIAKQAKTEDLNKEHGRLL
ncbi:hypothetical protein RRG08_066161 [Elysia crispata]|uniref:Uncharacterized protein n=1 Tax=Elysia crispata TaxID=231223 RepID=A0AAE0YBG6_9GAST|nr:hypothetical protein RRG08_066161 [Elysia crispata]